MRLHSPLKQGDTFTRPLNDADLSAHQARVAAIQQQIANNRAVLRQRAREQECADAGGHAYQNLLNGDVSYRCGVCERTIQRDGTYLESESVPEFRRVYR